MVLASSLLTLYQTQIRAPIHDWLEAALGVKVC